LTGAGARGTSLAFCRGDGHRRFPGLDVPADPIRFERGRPFNCNKIDEANR
jgi:hypothetical protein